jgi:hypothetical protein
MKTTENPKIMVHPSPETNKAIKDYWREGKWPKPGTLPVRINLGDGRR